MIDSKLVGAFAVAVAIEILMPLALGFWLKRRYGVSWGVFGYGALVFFTFQMITRIPLVQVIQVSIAPELRASEQLVFAWIVALSYSAGIFEEIGRWVGFCYFIRDKQDWKNALMFGAGHGGIESMVLVGVLSALTMVQVVALQGIDPSQLAVTPEQADQVVQAQQIFEQMDWWLPLVGAYERIMAMTLHLVLSVIVLQVFLRKSWKWLFVAICYHGTANLIAVLVAQRGGPLLSEGFLTVLAVLNIYLVLRLRSTPDQRVQTP